MRKITIAIDGYSSCGKSSMAKTLARSLGYIYVDTGAMYRAVTLYALRRGLFDGGELDVEGLRSVMSDVRIGFRRNLSSGCADTLLNGEDVEGAIRGMDVSERVSKVAALGFVRSAMVEEQRVMGRDKGIVMDGRDIGTTVFPDAELKVFVTASTAVRARRRFDELRGKGMECDYEEVLRNIEERDYLDSHREVSPLRRAEDAVVLDNSAMTIEEQDAWLLELATERINA